MGYVTQILTWFYSEVCLGRSSSSWGDIFFYVLGSWHWTCPRCLAGTWHVATQRWLPRSLFTVLKGWRRSTPMKVRLAGVCRKANCCLSYCIYDQKTLSTTVISIGIFSPEVSTLLENGTWTLLGNVCVAVTFLSLYDIWERKGKRERTFLRSTSLWCSSYVEISRLDFVKS